MLSPDHCTSVTATPFGVADDNAAHTVHDEVDFVHFVERFDDAVQIFGRIADVGPRAGVVETDDRVAVVLQPGGHRIE